MKPFPTDLPQTINPEAGPKRAGVETHRNLNCRHYDGCLDEAVPSRVAELHLCEVPTVRTGDAAADGD